MPTYIHFTRHAQGYHNLSTANHQLPDPDLTKLGEEQCRLLSSHFAHHASLTHLVASPMRRTLYTCLLSFAPPTPKTVLALPELQEVSNLPCDVGTDVANLKREFGDKVDFGEVDRAEKEGKEDGWNDKRMGGRWAPEYGALEERARRARVWLRELGRKGGEEGKDVHIAVVTHGGFLHFLTEDLDGFDRSKGTGWQNCECRSYVFVDEDGDDERASVKETEASWKARRGSEIGLTETEQMELRAALKHQLKEEFGGGEEVIEE